MVSERQYRLDIARAAVADMTPGDRYDLAQEMLASVQLHSVEQTNEYRAALRVASEWYGDQCSRADLARIAKRAAQSFHDPSNDYADNVERAFGYEIEAAVSMAEWEVFAL